MCTYSSSGGQYKYDNGNICIKRLDHAINAGSRKNKTVTVVYKSIPGSNITGSYEYDDISFKFLCEQFIAQGSGQMMQHWNDKIKDLLGFTTIHVIISNAVLRQQADLQCICNSSSLRHPRQTHMLCITLTRAPIQSPSYTSWKRTRRMMDEIRNRLNQSVELLSLLLWLNGGARNGGNCTVFLTKRNPRQQIQPLLKMHAN